MSKLSVPIVAIITGEGCSGGALGLAVADRVMMLEHAYYTVISPEGCASILWRDAAMYAEAAEALKITSKDLLEFGVIDEEIKEPLGGAHTNYGEAANNMKVAITKAFKELEKLPVDKLREGRYNKFRAMGRFIES
jgi:acetyl-CoA carboxylase carboxyl transferase subunit alpha